MCLLSIWTKQRSNAFKCLEKKPYMGLVIGKLSVALVYILTKGEEKSSLGICTPTSLHGMLSSSMGSLYSIAVYFREQITSTGKEVPKESLFNSILPLLWRLIGPRTCINPADCILPLLDTTLY